MKSVYLEPCASRKEAKASMLSEFDTVLGHRTISNKFWVAASKDGQQYITLFSFCKNKNGYSYYSEPEGEILYAHNCPLKLLEMTGDGPGTNPAWRAKVRAHHVAANRVFNVGDTAIMYGCEGGVFTVQGRHAGKQNRYLLKNKEGTIRHHVGSTYMFPVFT